MIDFAKENTRYRLSGAHDRPHFVFALAMLIMIKVNLTVSPQGRFLVLQPGADAQPSRHKTGTHHTNFSGLTVFDPSRKRSTPGPWLPAHRCWSCPGPWRAVTQLPPRQELSSDRWSATALQERRRKRDEQRTYMGPYKAPPRCPSKSGIECFMNTHTDFHPRACPNFKRVCSELAPTGTIDFRFVINPVRRIERISPGVML
jgi:hypothetical protein